MRDSVLTTSIPWRLLLVGHRLVEVLLIEKVAAASDDATASSNRRPYLLLAVLVRAQSDRRHVAGLEGAAGTFVVILIAIAGPPEVSPASRLG